MQRGARAAARFPARSERTRRTPALVQRPEPQLHHDDPPSIAGPVGPANPWDWRILANGRLDALLYERSTIDTSLPVAALRARSDVTEKAKASGTDPEFSRRIRAGLPGLR